jgi:hypothetical protein
MSRSAPPEPPPPPASVACGARFSSQLFTQASSFAVNGVPIGMRWPHGGLSVSLPYRTLPVASMGFARTTPLQSGCVDATLTRRFSTFGEARSSCACGRFAAWQPTALQRSTKSFGMSGQLPAPWNICFSSSVSVPGQPAAITTEKAAAITATAERIACCVRMTLLTPRTPRRAGRL